MGEAEGPDDLVLNAADAVVSGVGNPVLEKWLRDALTEAKGERDKLLASIESSFDAMTNRISGWYKRYATIWIFLISAAVALALNADSYAMGSRLWKDQAVRSALVAQADKLVDPATCDVKKTQSEQAGGSQSLDDHADHDRVDGDHAGDDRADDDEPVEQYRRVRV